MAELSPISQADLDLISAYIDGQLDGAALASFTQRLDRDPALRAALWETQGALALLRDLGPLVPPRSFTLDERAVAPARRAFWQLPALWMRLGSAAAAVLLAITFAGSGGLFGSSGYMMSTAPMSAASAPQDAPMAAEAPMAASGAAEDAPTEAAALAGAPLPEAAMLVPTEAAAVAADASGAAPVEDGTPALGSSLMQAEAATPDPTAMAKAQADALGGAASRMQPQGLDTTSPDTAQLEQAPPPAAAAAIPFWERTTTRAALLLLALGLLIGSFFTRRTI